jgi:predicted amidohydrolase YtcJ
MDGPSAPRAAAEAALAAAAAHGVTTLHDVSGHLGLEAYRDLEREGRLTARIAYFLPIPDVDGAGPLPEPGAGSARLRFAGLKGFIDGALGARTAHFFEPYDDDPDTRGGFREQMFPEGAMAARLRRADALGLQVALHAVGDRAVATVLDLAGEVAAAHGPRDRRWRIEHAQHLRPEDFARMARLGLIASVQPVSVLDDGCWAGARVGPRRLAGAYAFRSFLHAGVPMAFGSDWPGYPLDPILGIHAAVTRRTSDGQCPGGWIPDQKISLEAAIRAYTLGGAYAESAEGDKGSITPGKLADLVVLDRNLFELPPPEIREARVAATICGGAVVFQA